MVNSWLVLFCDHTVLSSPVLWAGCRMEVEWTIDGLIRLTLEVGSLSFPNVIVDTGSAQTWLPANLVTSRPSLRLAGTGPGMCEPLPINFSHRYADGSGASGVLCRAKCRLAGLQWQQVIGAATTVSESEELQSAGFGFGAGVLALSPAAKSSFWALLRALPSNAPLLSLCAPRAPSVLGHLVLGGYCAAGLGRAPLASAPPLALHMPDPDGGRASPRHWKVAATSVLMAMQLPLMCSLRPQMTGLVRLLRAGEVAILHIDSGSSHIVAERSFAPQLERAMRCIASLALTLRSSPVRGHANATSRRTRPPMAPPPDRPSPQPLLVPLSYDCGPLHGGREACVRGTISPGLPRLHAPRWVLGVPLFRHVDVALEATATAASGELHEEGAPAVRLAMATRHATFHSLETCPAVAMCR